MPDDTTRKPPRAGMGRPKGATNRRTREQQEIALLIVEGNADKVQGWLDRTARRNPGKAAELYLRFLEFVKPKLARTLVQADIRALPPPPQLGIDFSDGGPGIDLTTPRTLTSIETEVDPDAVH